MMGEDIQSYKNNYWRHIYTTINFINPACAAKVTVVVLCVCLPVCLSVYDYSRTTGYEMNDCVREKYA